MKLHIILPVLIILGYTANGNPACDDKIRNAKVIPLFANEITSSDLTGAFGDVYIQCGKDYSPNDCQQHPTYIYRACGFPPEKCQYVTTMFFGGGFLNESKDTVFLHSMEYNVPVKSVSDGRFHGQYGDVAASFVPPTNAPGPARRHLLFVYCQKDYIRNYKVYDTSTEERKGFNPKLNAKTYKYGDPVIATYFTLTARNQ